MAISFDGANDRITYVTGHSAAFNATSWTWSGWVNFTALPGAAAEMCIFTIGSNATTDEQWLVVQEVSGSFFLEFNVNKATSDGLWLASTNLTTATWYHIAVTYDNSSDSNDPIIYLNGTAETLTPTLGVGAVTNPDRLRLGELMSGSGDFNGLMAEVAFWGEILDSSEVTSLANGYVPLYLITPTTTLYSDLQLAAAMNQFNATAPGTIGLTALAAHPPKIIPYWEFPEYQKIVVAAGGSRAVYLSLLGVGI